MWRVHNWMWLMEYDRRLVINNWMLVNNNRWSVNYNVRSVYYNVWSVNYDIWSVYYLWSLMVYDIRSMVNSDVMSLLCMFGVFCCLAFLWCFLCAAFAFCIMSLLALCWFCKFVFL